MPSKPVMNVMTVGSQRDSRYIDTFYDQHRFSPKFSEGRPWHGYREFAANKPDLDGFIGGELSPGRHVERDEQGNITEDPKEAWATIWSAPWIPEYKYFEFNYRRNRITIRYDRVFGDDKSALDNYYRAAAKLAGANGWGAVKYGVTPSFQVTSQIGDPTRSPKIAQAAQAGDLWLLGFNEEVNEELALLLGLTTDGLKLVTEPFEPPLKVEQILSAPSAYDIQKLVAEAVASALAKKEADDKEAVKAKMAKMRAKRKPTTATSAGRNSAA